MNSRNKGARGEREWAKVLTDAGFPAIRGVQHSGGPDSPDVICNKLPFHWEVKRVQRLVLEVAMAQAINDAGKKNIPAVAHRKNRQDWLVTMRASDLLKLLRRIY